MPFKTRVTDLLSIEHPIVMGGMTGVGTAQLAAAVSLAGGLGIMAIHNSGKPEQARKDVQLLRKLCNGKPFGVNLTILPSFDPPPYDEYAKIIIEEKVPIVETAGSNPKKWISLFKSNGVITIHKCVSIRHALKAQAMGVDIVSLDGFECAGHPGEEDVGNFVLQARGCQELAVPYVCSGGVASGVQLAAALALGADGVNCGTLFCATQECNWPQSFKDRMVQSKETDTVLMLRRLNNTCRVIRNDVSAEVEEIESKKGEDFQISDVMPLVNGKRGREAEAKCDPDGGIWSAGQSVGLIKDIPTVKKVVDDMVKEAENVVRTRLNSLLVVPSRL